MSRLLYVAITAGMASACGNARLAETDETPTVAAAAETTGIRGNADDPAIWVNPANPVRSAIIGTDKRGGLEVYDLSGARLHRRDDGRLNNVDVRGMIVAGSNRSDDTVVVYRIDPTTRALTRLGAVAAGLTVYGMCLYRSSDRVLYAFVNSKQGEVAQLRLDVGDASVSGERVRTLAVPSQPEGCVVDDRAGVLYLGEEDRGIWRFGAAADAGPEGRLIDIVGGGHLVADVEGLALYTAPHGGGYLIASSQGDDAYVVYRRDDNTYLGRFRVSLGDDAASHSDGIDATSAALGDAFPRGLFVAHDTDNGDDTGNFKLVSWDNIAAILRARR